jgi:hypothetical protein
MCSFGQFRARAVSVILLTFFGALIGLIVVGHLISVLVHVRNGLPGLLPLPLLDIKHGGLIQIQNVSYPGNGPGWPELSIEGLEQSSVFQDEVPVGVKAVIPPARSFVHGLAPSQGSQGLRLECFALSLLAVKGGPVGFKRHLGGHHDSVDEVS